MPSKKSSAKLPIGPLTTPILLSDPDSDRKKTATFREQPYITKRKRYNDELADARLAKMPLLFSHFGIAHDDPKQWEKLAWALTITYVPGFGAHYKNGAPVTITRENLAKLLEFFDRKKAKLESRSGRVTKTHICAALLKDIDFQRALPDSSKVGQKHLMALIKQALDCQKLDKEAAAYAKKFNWEHLLKDAD